MVIVFGVGVGASGVILRVLSVCVVFLGVVFKIIQVLMCVDPVLMWVLWQGVKVLCVAFLRG